MRIEYVFIKKENARIKSKDGLTPLDFLLRKIFGSVSDNIINFKYKLKEYAVHYNCISHRCEKIESNDDMQYLTIELCDKNKSRVAEVLDAVNQNILNHSEKGNYDVIISYDGISKYYCDKIYPLLNEFERQIRNLIYKLLTRSFGALWLEKTATLEQQNSIKAKMQIRQKSLKNQKMIEEALYEMDIKALENYLFLPRSEMDIDKLRANEFTNDRLCELSQKSAIELIKKLRPMSLWERYFDEEVDIPQLQEKLENIRNYRNKVAHSKHFYKNDYDVCKKILAEILPLLDKAVQDVSVKDYDPMQLQEAVRSLKDICDSTRMVNNGLSPALDILARKLEEIKNSNQRLIASSVVQLKNKIANNYRPLLDFSETLCKNRTYLLIQSELQKQRALIPSSVFDNAYLEKYHFPDWAEFLKSINYPKLTIPEQSVLKNFKAEQARRFPYLDNSTHKKTDDLHEDSENKSSLPDNESNK